MANWQEVNQQTLDAIDLAAEYRAMGLDITGDPGPGGWAPCRVFRSESGDRNPSAGVNLTGEHPAKGRYKEFTGDGRNLSFFEFCAVAGKFPSWKAARDHYRKAAGIKGPRGSQPDTLDEQFEWRPFNDVVAATWCRTRPPITADAFRMAGGRLATWNYGNRPVSVVVLPIFDEHGVDADPCGYVYWRLGGGMLPVSQGKGKEPVMVKMKTAKGSQSGSMNRYGLTMAGRAEVIWKTEGPGDMLALQSVIPPELRERHVVITNSGGSTQNPREWELVPFADKTVYVCHDCDKAGQDGAAKWAAAIATVAKEVRQVTLPYEVVENHGKDLRDWLNQGGTYTDLLALAESSPLVEPPSVANAAAPTAASTNGKPHDTHDAADFDRQICESIGITVIGESPDRSITLWCDATRKGDTISTINRFSFADLLQICGPGVRSRVHEGQEEVPGLVHVRKVQHAIASQASQRRLSSEQAKGRGVWGGNNGTVIIVNAREAAVWDSKTLSRVSQPFAAGKLLDLATPRPWFGFDQLVDLMDRCQDPQWVKDSVNEVIDIFNAWTWREGHYVSTALAGLVMATWTQSLWPWRPHVAIRGQSNSGKSILLQTVASLLGDRLPYMLKATAAGIAQNVGTSSDPIIIDEFESDRHRKQVLELLRTSSRGGMIPRGTSGLHGRMMGLKHIVWTGAVEIGLVREPDRNRYIAAESVIPERHLMGKLAPPPAEELRKIGLRLMAISVYFVRQAIDLHEWLRQQQYPGHDQRAVESFSVPTSILALADGRRTKEGAAELLGVLLRELNDASDEGPRLTDQEQLLRDILDSWINLPHSGQATAAQILDKPSDYSEGTARLEQAGLSRVQLKAGPRSAWDEISDSDSGLFIAPSLVSRHLLWKTHWADQQIDQILVRLEGAERSRRRIAGTRAPGILVPWEVISKLLGNEDEI